MKNSNKSKEWIGHKFGRLTVIGIKPPIGTSRSWRWETSCDCGVVKNLLPSEVKCGKIKSCGCLHNDVAKERATKFKNLIANNKRLYNIYNKMKRRCLNQNEPRFKDYGGRGIKVALEWMESFDAFATWAKENGYDDALTLERIDVNGDYCPENCKWIPLAGQAKNKRDTIYVEYKGKMVKMQDLANEAKVSYDTLHNRITNGWSVELAVNTPSKNLNKSLRSKCIEKGINYGTVRSRIFDFGWDEDAALNTPPRRSYHKVNL